MGTFRAVLRLVRDKFPSTAMLAAIATCVTAWLTACGGSESAGATPQGSGGEPSAGSGGTTGGAGGVPSTGGAGGTPACQPGCIQLCEGGACSCSCPSGSCPPTLPGDGSTCTGSIGPCTFGDHALPYCRATAGCANGKWTVTPMPAACTQLTAGCPASVPTGACAAAGTVACVYPDAYCSCAVCCDAPGCFVFCDGQPQGSHVWGCTSAPRGQPPCPATAPNRGSACELPSGTACVSDPCGLNIICDGGVWTWEYKREPICMAACASPDTPVSTPDGDRSIADLRVGDLVYSVDENAIRPVPVARVRRVPVAHHSVLRITLSGGARLEVSPLHPTADGKTLGDLRVGEVLDGHQIKHIELTPYVADSTYDILPASETGTYFAAGVLIGSTLVP